MLSRSVHRRLDWWSAGFGAAAGAVLIVLAHRALGDDAWITVNYVRDLAEHGHWGLLPATGVRPDRLVLIER